MMRDSLERERCRRKVSLINFAAWLSGLAVGWKGGGGF